MLTPEIQKKINSIQLQVKKILQGTVAGDLRSKKKGFGLEFEQLREYQLGDDIRYIDWKSTARTNKMLVKEFIHEHSLTVMIAVDVSASHNCGSSAYLKSEIINQIASILVVAAEFCQARVGLLLFSQNVELYIPPQAGKVHNGLLLKKLWDFQPQKQETNLNTILEYLAKISKKDSLIFMLSDFIDKEFERPLKNVAQRYDLVAIRCLDAFEKKLPEWGCLTVEDPETGEQMLINLQSFLAQEHLCKRLKIQEDLFKKNGIDYLDIINTQPYVDLLVNFFARRICR